MLRLVAMGKVVLYVLLCVATVWGQGEEVTFSSMDSSGEGEDRVIKKAPPEGNTVYGLQLLVRVLQTQLKESQVNQVRTRSILNEIQETQLRQEQDLRFLKNEISALKESQADVGVAIQVLESAAEDNRWGVANIKASQHQVRKDFATVKAWQDVQNDTILQFQDMVDINVQWHKGHHDTFTDVKQEIRDLKDTLAKDRVSLKKIKLAVTDHLRENGGKPDNNTHPNNIPPLTNGHVNIPDSSGESTHGIDETSTPLEERDNKVDHNLVKILQHEYELKRDMDAMRQRYAYYEGEMARTYTMFFNLSLQVSNLENRMLLQQKNKFSNEMSDLQKTFVNFTHQMFNLEQWHSMSHLHANTSVQNQHDLALVSDMAGSNDIRIKTMEELFVEQRRANHQSTQLLHDQLRRVNATVQTIHNKLFDHSDRADDTFEDVGAKMRDLARKIDHVDGRLRYVEVKVFNESLQTCEKANTDLLQEVKLTRFEEDLSGFDERLLDNSDEVTRLDRGLAKVYNDGHAQAKVVTEIMDHVKKLLDLSTEVATVQLEVDNLIIDLPLDCDQAERDGVQLIKPKRSRKSARTYCQTDPQGAWTVVQMRTDGTVSFDRTWDAYKDGFGDPQTEFWLGNDNLHYLTTQGDYLLHIDMWDLDDQYWWAEYDYFKVDEEGASYRLHIDGYHGNATDALRYSNFMPFSTIDRDNDASSTHCAKFYTSGWWYKHCHYSNLNGRYTVGVVWFNTQFDEWVQLQRAVMKIRPSNGTRETGV